MEKEFKMVTLLNINNMIRNMDYGSIYVEYSGDQARKEMLHVIDTVNKIAGNPVINEAPFVDGWEEAIVPGKYRITYGDRVNPVPTFTDDDLNVWDTIKAAAAEKSVYKVSINPALVKLVKKECRELRLKYGFDFDGDFVIDGREKQVSVYKRIQTAHSEGASQISFDLSEVNLPTVRTYASQFGAAIMQKIKCTTADGKIIVHFREDVAEELRSALIKAGEVMSAFDILSIVSELYPQNAQEAPQWQILGFDNPQDYQEYIAIKAAALEDLDNSGSDMDSEPRVETVDGLQQFVIPGMVSAYQEPENNFRYLGEADLAYPETPPKGMPEDEDF